LQLIFLKTFKIELFINSLATQCKSMFEKMTEEKPKSIPEVPKVKPLPINRDRRSVKLVKSKEEPVVKPPVEEKTVPTKIDNYKSYNNYDYATPSPATSDLPSDQSYASKYTSLSQSNTPVYNGTYINPYNR